MAKQFKRGYLINFIESDERKPIQYMIGGEVGDGTFSLVRQITINGDDMVIKTRKDGELYNFEVLKDVYKTAKIIIDRLPGIFMIKILRPQILISETNQLCLVESRIRASFVKFSTNFGLPLETRRMQALSHFSHESSRGIIMLTDLQGFVERGVFLLTDITVHTRQGRFCDGDLGQRGIELFYQSHECNEFCTLLKVTRRYKNTPDVVMNLRTKFTWQH